MQFDYAYDELAVALSYAVYMGQEPPKGGPAPTAAPTAKAVKASAAPAPAAAGGDDDMGGDDLFGDDDGAEETKAAPAMSLAEKAKAAKAAKEAKKKKSKIEKSQVLIEVKPWEADQDLPALYAKICAEVTPEGLQWGEAFKLEEVGYGIKKLVMSCVIEDEKVMTDDFLEPIGEMEEEVQSVDMLTMNRL